MANSCLKVGGITVWRSNILEAAPVVVLSEEATRAERYLNETARRCFVRGRSLLRALAGSALGIEPLAVPISQTANGKPFVPTAKDFAFNLSHSGPWVVVALFSRAIGVDIEARERGDGTEALARRYFAPQEVRLLERLPLADRSTAFIQHWVCKEAVLKCSGHGISDSLTNAVCQWKEGRIQAVRFEGLSYAITEFVCGKDYLGAVTAGETNEKVRFYEASWDGSP